MLNQVRLKELLSYDPITGKFTWVKSTSRKIKVGSVAGYTDTNNYTYIGVDGRNYKASRLAFLYMEGYIPEEVDHKNTISNDDSWGNLRASSRSQNAQNRNKHKNNKTGFKGVEVYGKRFRARINRKHLGVFDTPEEAHAEYVKAAIETYGEFARY